MLAIMIIPFLLFEVLILPDMMVFIALVIFVAGGILFEQASILINKTAVWWDSVVYRGEEFFWDGKDWREVPLWVQEISRRKVMRYFPNAVLEIVYDEIDPYLRVTLNGETCYIAHW